MLYIIKLLDILSSLNCSDRKTIHIYIIEIWKFRMFIKEDY